MSAARRVLLLVESNTTGTGRQFARRARELGIEPVLLTTDPDRYPYAALDALRTELADTSDESAVLATARRVASGSGAAGPAEIVGVTSSSEYYIAAAAATAARLGLPGPEPDAVRACRDKALQRRRLRQVGLPVPRFAVVRDTATALAAARRIGFPVVLKPVQGSGSLGVRKCADADETARHAAALGAATVNERGVAVPPDFLVEEYLPGDEYSVEVLGTGALAVVAKHLGPPPVFVETGHDLPAPVDGTPDGDALRSLARRAVTALGLGWGAAHVELRLRGGEAHVIEVNPRLAGGMIPELVRRARGVDLVAEQVRAAAGLAPRDAPRAPGGAAAIRFLTTPHAAVLGDADTLAELLAAARRTAGVVDVALYREAGAPVAPATDFRGRVGHVIAEADEPAAAGRAAEHGLVALREALRRTPTGTPGEATG
ncbi:ATP-grasp domain-containing protein [Streptomyces sp. NPDC050504]|uniref:ATP-grasp domain-containing protein n=1 Tax=Streptomyces sp. NPDC050504 TaxID=3365618 RepID=UPI0037A9E353